VLLHFGSSKDGRCEGHGGMKSAHYFQLVMARNRFVKKKFCQNVIESVSKIYLNLESSVNLLNRVEKGGGKGVTVKSGKI
jgi:hypothetical protein